jgi:opacity protein-like surface antigen
MKKSFLFYLSSVSLLFCFLFTNTASAQTVRPITTTLAFSTYQITNGDDTLDGTGVSLSILYPLNRQWGIYGAVFSGSAEGDHQNSDGSESRLESETSKYGGGINWTLDAKRFRPYVQAGVFYQSYEYRFEYAGSETGTTSGNSIGYQVGGGVKMLLSRHFILIPGFSYSSADYETETGETKTMESGGMTLALVAGF